VLAAEPRDKSARVAPSGRAPSARSCPILYTQSEPRLVPASGKTRFPEGGLRSPFGCIGIQRSDPCCHPLAVKGVTKVSELLFGATLWRSLKLTAWRPFGTDNRVFRIAPHHRPVRGFLSRSSNAEGVSVGARRKQLAAGCASEHFEGTMAVLENSGSRGGTPESR
jgi:hypothetical protein